MEIPFRAIVDSLTVGIVFTDPQGRIVYCNEAEGRIRGLDPARLVGKSILSCHSAHAAAKIEQLLTDFAAGVNPGFQRMNDRNAKFIEQWFSPVLDSAGSYLGMLLVSTDVTALEASRRKFEVLATRDELTGLYSKNYYATAYAAVQKQLGREFSTLALVMVDVNGLKDINDFLGHEAGDRVITGTATILRRSIRVTDSAFRFGGDEFVILMPGADEGAAKAATRRIKAGCRRWTDEHPDLPISVGVGWAIAESPEQVEHLFERADEAMYRDKRKEKDRLARMVPPDRAAK